LNNDQTGTLRVKAAGFRLYNVNVNNSYGKGSQAIALSAQADSGYYGCAFMGYQDTLLSNEGYQLYVKCMISGATDFIFGQRASAWFEKCDIRVVTSTLSYITGTSPKPILAPPPSPEMRRRTNHLEQPTVENPPPVHPTTSLTTAISLPRPAPMSQTGPSILAARGENTPESSFREARLAPLSTQRAGGSGTPETRGRAVFCTASMGTRGRGRRGVGPVLQRS
jgi:hypothetical protein